MESFILKYNKLCQEAGLTRENMAKLLDMGEVSVEAIETGYVEPKIETLMRLSEIFGVSIAYLANLTDDPKCTEPHWAKEVYVVDTLLGKNGIITKENVVDTVFINRDEIRGKDYNAVIMKDDSMTKARIFKDDVLIVKRQTAASNGQVVVAEVDGKEVVRRFTRKGNMVTLLPESDSEKYMPIRIDEAETKFKILGVVSEVRIKKL